MKKILFSLTLILGQIIVIAQCDNSCLPDGISFFSQSSIDDFQINYPGCTEIEGHVNIIGDNITNLNGLNLLTAIGGELKLNHTGALTDLNGLNLLQSIGGDFTINNADALTNLVGLDNLQSIGGDFYIDRSDSLVDLIGLNNLTSIGSNLQIG